MIPAHARRSPPHPRRPHLLRAWEIFYEGKERELLAALGGPLSIEIETSCWIDPPGNRHETGKVKVAIWPHPGPHNLGQARFYDVDSRRRFWVNLLGAVGTTVVDWLWACRPGSVGKDGVTLTVPERPRSGAAPSPASTP